MYNIKNNVSLLPPIKNYAKNCVCLEPVGWMNPALCLGAPTETPALFVQVGCEFRVSRTSPVSRVTASGPKYLPRRPTQLVPALAETEVAVSSTHSNTILLTLRVRVRTHTL